MAFSFLNQELAIDLGTANTIIYQNDKIVLDEPSIVAIDNNTGKPIAIGQEAKLMSGKEYSGIRTIRPLRDGVIADFNAAEMMIRGFIKRASGNRTKLFTPNIKVVVGIPSGSTEVEIRAVRDSSEHAGGRDVYLIYEPMAAALGIGLDVLAPQGNMVVDIGGGTTEIAVISLGGSGVVSVLSNILPVETQALVQAALDGDFDTAADLQIKLLPLTEVLFAEVNPIPVKAAMKLMGFDCGDCRLPLTAASQSTVKKLKKLLLPN